jgi:PKD repeat protein
MKNIYIVLILIFGCFNVKGERRGLSAATSLPIANFNTESFCNGSYFFKDSSLNIPTQWQWDFGDGYSSLSQNPLHTYSSVGTYQVKLKVSNSLGSDSIVKSVVINTLFSPLPLQCSPSSNYFSHSMSEINFGSIHKITPDTNSCFIDNSCSNSTIVTAGQTYIITVKIDQTSNHRVMAWIDYNNDGMLDSVNEVVFNSPPSLIHSGAIKIPTNATYNFPLRMRIGYESSYYYTVLTPCSNIQNGQYQDFSIVIQPSNLAPKADFFYSSICNGTFSFNDSTYINCATSWLWDFGDGSFSTQQNPIHKFSSSGNYSVKLKVCNAVSCDSIVKVISNTAVDGLLDTKCHPGNSSVVNRIGIFKVTFNTINQSSEGAKEGYKDFTCAGGTTIIAGDQIPITVLTDSISFENVKAWIDFNNDGLFNAVTEQVFQSDHKQLMHTGIINTSPAYILNTPLRMRVCDDTSTVVIMDACSNLSRGQAEDYTVTFVSNSQSPIGAFSADYTTINNGTTVHFTDLSQHLPTSWQWYFPGGSPSTSNLRNPSVLYSNVGNYAVTLVSKNSFGQDSIVKTNYIHITNGVLMCSTSVTNAASGSFYDSGGPTGNYYSPSNCSLLIQPTCAGNITMSFNQFNVSANFDYLYIYDGLNNSAPLIASGTGGTFPIVVTANSGSMFIVFQSTSGSSNTGWNASWTTNISSTNPVDAEFSVSSNNPPYGTTVNFTDQSINSPTSWKWDFGDGFSSEKQNPNHTFAKAGTYLVLLRTSNCSSIDTVTHTIVVQGVPTISINPDTIEVTLGCDDSLIVPLKIYNTGSNDLTLELNSIQADEDTIQILEFSGVTNLGTSNNQFKTFLSSFAQPFKKYKINTLQSLLPADLQKALKGMDVLVFPSQYFANGYNNYASLSSVVNDFVSSGKTVIICASSNINRNARAYEMGLFTGKFSAKTIHDSQPNLEIIDTTNFITNIGVNRIIINGYTNEYVYEHLVTNSDKSTLISNNQDYDILTYRSIGKGRAFNFGYDCYPSYVYEMEKIMMNIVKSSKDSALNWLTHSTAPSLIHPGDSLIFNLSITAKDLHSGYYSKDIFISSNDTAHSKITVPVNLHVTAAPTLELSTTCLNFPSIMENRKEQLSFRISNSGCDTLHISNIQSTNSVFTFSATNLSVASGQSKEVIVYFESPTVGTFIDSIHIQNDFNGDSVICLAANATAAPIIYLPTPTLSSTLYACSDSVQLTAYIHNDGSTNLNYSLRAPVKILAVLNAVDTAVEFKHIINALNKYYPNYRLDTITVNSAIELKAALSNKDVVLFPEGEFNAQSYNGFYYSMASPVLDFVNSGGKAIVCGSYYSTYYYPNTIKSLGLMNVNFINFYFSPIRVTNIDSTSTLLNGVSNGFFATNASYGISTYYDSSIVQVASVGSNCLVAYKNMGLGKAIYLGFDYFEPDSAIERIMANAVNIDTTGLPFWLMAAPYTGTILPGDSALITITINSAGLVAGNHISNVYISSNDPLRPLDSLNILLTVRQNPCADFSFESSSCNGFVTFSDRTFNSPTTFYWDFGDGNSSTLQNPNHMYTSTGNFMVKLVVCTSFSCDSVIKQVTINSLIGPNPPVFFPIQTRTAGSNLYRAGIWHVELNNINHSDNNILPIYSDYSCSDTTTLNVGGLYTIIINTDTVYREKIGVWIDYNNDNDFDTITEKVLITNTRYKQYVGSFIVPSGVVVNQRLRMRIAADTESSNYNIDPNYTPLYGEVEDYAVILKPNQLPPVAKFYFNQVCGGGFTFIDSSYHEPTSWFWDFGDGDTSHNQNISHTYAANGNYIVKLVTCNSFGCDSSTFNITITTMLGPVSTSCICNTTSYSSIRGGGITRVIFNTIDKTSLDGIEGYQNNTCSNMTTVTAGLKYPIEIYCSKNSTSIVKVWIDFNNDGNLDSIAELVLFKYVQYITRDSIYIPGSAVVLKPLRMRIIGEDSYFSFTDPCKNVIYGQAEDYSVIIQPSTLPLICNYSLTQQSSCNGMVVFKDSSVNVPASWLWDFGDGTTSTDPNPTHVYSAVGQYTIKLIVCKPTSCDSIIKQVVISSLGGPKNCSCIPSSPPVATTYTTTVQLSMLNKTSVSSPTYYDDFSCTDSAMLLINTNYQISIGTNTSNQKVASAWIDFNNDGEFDPISELILSKQGGSSISGNFIVPSNAVLNTPLRMRTATGPNTYSPCFVGLHYQDFKIVIKPLPPIAKFGFTQTCSGYVTFKDSSLNSPTSWYWTFGDGGTSNIQNPNYHYSNTGVFTVKLVVCNANRCDSISKNITITNILGPITASCLPNTNSYCCSIGIQNVSIANINKLSNFGNEGYKDFSCTDTTTLIGSQSYLLTVTTGPTYFENVKAWIDFNNDGVFDNSNELVFNSPNRLQYHSGTITIPSNAVLNTSLRMRIGDDLYSSPTPSPCNNAMYGQFEDYAVTITSTQPIANFEYNQSCSNTIGFKDSSLNFPISWTWDFGDGTGSNLQNPTHTFLTTGTYQVKLIACNAIGCDTLVRALSVITSNNILSPSCIPSTIGSCCGIGIKNVSFNAINKSSTDASEGYQDFSCNDSTVVSCGSLYSITITTGNNFNENVRAWIDFNNDGNFNSPNELVFTSNNQLVNHSGNVFIPGSPVTNSILRMRIGDDLSSLAPLDGCSNPVYGQYEDYAVNIVPSILSPIANFSVISQLGCGDIAYFTDSSLNVPTSWKWFFGDGDSSLLQMPNHQYLTSGNYWVSLIVSNSFGSDTISKTISISIFSDTITYTGNLVEGQPIQFNNSILNAVSYNWNFGDGHIAISSSPSHIYASAGTYIVKLILNTGSCIDTIIDTIVIQSAVGLNEAEQTSLFVSPNPFSNELKMSFVLNAEKRVSLKVLNVVGEIVSEVIDDTYIKPGSYSYKFKTELAGTYFIQFTINGITKAYKIVNIN